MCSLDCILDTDFVSSSEWIYSRPRSWFNEDHEYVDSAIYVASPEKSCDCFSDEKMYLLGQFLQENFQNTWVHLNVGAESCMPLPDGL